MNVLSQFPLKICHFRLFVKDWQIAVAAAAAATVSRLCSHQTQNDNSMYSICLKCVRVHTVQSHSQTPNM